MPTNSRRQMCVAIAVGVLDSLGIATAWGQSTPPPPPLPASSSAVVSSSSTAGARPLEHMIRESEGRLRSEPNRVLARLFDDPRLQKSVDDATSRMNRLGRALNRPTNTVDKLPYGGGVATNLYRAARAHRELQQFKALAKSQSVQSNPFVKKSVGAMQSYLEGKRNAALVGATVSLVSDSLGLAGYGSGVVSTYLTAPALQDVVSQATQLVADTIVDVPQSLAVDQVMGAAVDQVQGRLRGEAYIPNSEKEGLLLGRAEAKAPAQVF